MHKEESMETYSRQHEMEAIRLKAVDKVVGRYKFTGRGAWKCILGNMK